MTKKQEPKEIDPKDQKISKLQSQITELTSDLQRLQADTENYKKHLEKENQKQRTRERAQIVEQLLPLLDSFDLAIQNKDQDQFKSGVEMIYSQFIDTLEKQGLKPIETTNQALDPYKHEVLLTEPTENKEEDNTIAQELQKGYYLGDQVLRYAKVKIKKLREDTHGKKD